MKVAILDPTYVNIVLLRLYQLNTLKAKFARATDEATKLREELSETKLKLNKVRYM